MLAHSDLETVRQVLETERLTLLQTIEGQQAGLPIDDNPDEEDLADYVAHQGLQSSLDQFSQAVLDRINRALDRLKAGTYGACVGCSLEIPPERLLALPYAEMCVACQSESEKKSRLLQ